MRIVFLWRCGKIAGETAPGFIDPLEFATVYEIISCETKLKSRGVWRPPWYSENICLKRLYRSGRVFYTISCAFLLLFPSERQWTPFYLPGSSLCDWKSAVLARFIVTKSYSLIYEKDFPLLRVDVLWATYNNNTLTPSRMKLQKIQLGLPRRLVSRRSIYLLMLRFQDFISWHQQSSPNKSLHQCDAVLWRWSHTENL